MPWKCFCTIYSFHRTRFRTRYSAAFRYFTKIQNFEWNPKEFVPLEFYHISKFYQSPQKCWENNGRILQKFVGIILFQSTEWGMIKQCVKTPYRQFVQVPLDCNRGYFDRFSLELTNCLVKCSFMTLTNVFGVTRQLIGQFWMHEGAVDINGITTGVMMACTLSSTKPIQTWKQSGSSRD